MKSLYKKLSTITAILFLAGTVGVTYYLYEASAHVTKVLQIRESNQIELVEQALKPVSTAVGVEIFLGIAAVLFLLLNKQSVAININGEKADANFSGLNSTTTNATDSNNTDKRVSIIENKLQETYPDASTKLEKILSSICNELEACQGAIFQAKHAENKRTLEMCASYAYFLAESKTISYEFGEGLTGQVAKEGKLINISTVPDGYVTIISGLGNSSPKHLIIVPIISYAATVGVIEIASFKAFTQQDEMFIKELSPLLADILPIQYQAETTTA